MCIRDSGVATVARRLRIDVHNNIDNNDNAWQRGPLCPHPWNGPNNRNWVKPVASHYGGRGMQMAGTWYLLVELNGTSQHFLLRARYSLTLPIDSSTHLSNADSDASPLHSLHHPSHTPAAVTLLCPLYTWRLAGVVSNKSRCQITRIRAIARSRSRSLVRRCLFISSVRVTVRIKVSEYRSYLNFCNAQ